MYSNGYIMKAIEKLQADIKMCLFPTRQAERDYMNDGKMEQRLKLEKQLSSLVLEGNYFKAEKMLQERLESDPSSFLLQAVHFYKQLAGMPEQELVEQGYSRELLVQGIHAIQEKYLSHMVG